MTDLQAIYREEHRRLTMRRIVFFSSVLVLTSLGTWVLADILWRGGVNPMEWVMLTLFVPLFGMVAFGFVQAVAGFLVLVCGRAGWFWKCAGAAPAGAPLPAVAIVAPVFNENIRRVCEGLRAIYLSLASKGALAPFDFFILSDSTDPDRWIEEEDAWVALCKQLHGFGRIFYRKRKSQLNRKSGNISDFCRRWGRKYRYMVVLDADSIMDSDVLVELVRRMEANPHVGIIQTAPAQFAAQTLHARIMQFCSALYGPLFHAGLDFWQGGEGNYWGHNAILRVAPFMEHCALPDLPGTLARPRPKFMSHDYVEAALMRRAGYEVRLAYDLPGSYEEGPPTLIDHARRDRRWCRGNLQHAWLVPAAGFHAISRLHLLLGIMSYVSSPLWLLFLIFGTMECWFERLTVPLRTFDYDVGLSSFLDIGGVRLALYLFLFTMAMLFVPKILALALALMRRTMRQSFGGMRRLIFSVLLEQLHATLLAPVMMLFNTVSVVSILLGREVIWTPQNRDAGGGVRWREAFSVHAYQTVVGLIWAALAWQIDRAFFWWLSPVTAGLIMAGPLSVWFSRPAWGKAAHRRGLFWAPSETRPPLILRHLEKRLAGLAAVKTEAETMQHPWLMRAVLDPYINAIHVSLLRQGRQTLHRVNPVVAQLQEKLLREGPTALSRREQMSLLANAEAMAWLHEQIWLRSDRDLAPWWVKAMHVYNAMNRSSARTFGLPTV